MAYFRSTTSKGNTYLQFVESYRDKKGQSQKRVLANIGNITKMSDEKVEQLTLSFIRAAGLQEKFFKYEFEAGKGYHYGTVLPVMALWHQLGLTEIIEESMPEKVEIPVARIALIQTANRFSDPGSKLACHRWYYRSVFSQISNFVHFPVDEEDERLHTFYRALDYLSDAKKEIEKRLYWKLLGYGMDTTLVLYDITSTYFEGVCSAMGKKGYSRDKRADCDQIVVGLVMSRDGIPIAHHVYAGNRVDKTTVQEVVGDLKGRFGIERAVFVGDRGMVSVENIEAMKEKQWEYIVGLQRRNRKVIDWLLGKIEVEKRIQEFGWEDLSGTLQKRYRKGVRFVVSYNRKMAERSRRTRERNIAVFEELVKQVEKEGELRRVNKSADRLKGFLYSKHLKRYYRVTVEKEGEQEHRLKVEKQEKILQRERLLDGRYFLQTELAGERIDVEEIDSCYRSLQTVERAFRALKGEIEIRPMHVVKERRIRGHVMIAYFALLIERLIEKKLQELYPKAAEEKWVKKGKRNGEEPLTMKTLYEELEGVRLIPLMLSTEHKDGKQERVSYISTKIDNNVRSVLSAVGVRHANNPNKLSFVKPKERAEKDQLVLDFSGSGNGR